MTNRLASKHNRQLIFTLMKQGLCDLSFYTWLTKLSHDININNHFLKLIQNRTILKSKSSRRIHNIGYYGKNKTS